jgi:hypothetical protein
MLEKYGDDWHLAMGFEKGGGFDQVWRSGDGDPPREWLIGEAKGAGASAGDFAKGAQMGRRWVLNTVLEMALSSDAGARALAAKLFAAMLGEPPVPIRGILVEAAKPASDDPIPRPVPDNGGSAAGYRFLDPELLGNAQIFERLTQLARQTQHPDLARWAERLLEIATGA